MMHRINKDMAMKILVVLIAAALLPAVIAGVTSLVAAGIDSIGEGIRELLKGPFQFSGSSQMQALVKLCLWIVAVMVLAKFILGKRG